MRQLAYSLAGLGSILLVGSIYGLAKPNAQAGHFPPITPVVGDTTAWEGG